MEALQAEIQRKRKEREALTSGGSAAGGAKKWMKRGELEKKKEAAYREAEAQDQEDRARRIMAPQQRNAALAAEQAAQTAAVHKNAAGDAAHSTDTGAGGSAVGSSSSTGGKSSTSKDEGPVRPADVMRRLRALGQPICLFAETDEERYDRYCAVSSALPSETEYDLELKKGQMFDQRQLFDESGNARQETAKATDEHKADDEADEENEDELAPTFVPSTPEETVAQHFKQLLKLWEQELGQREPAEAASQAGRTATATFQQCKRHTRQFFKQLKTRTMPLDVLSTMVEITSFMQQREYVKAHDAYIRCAIGTAPWPMGITGTGIHERQGRQHLRESKVAHVMNDETQRKYLQSVKRLMSFAQRKLPADPSKMVLTNL